ncbi:MAG: exo-alpha-sialidase [Fimbriimonadaceae bacterium]|nr:exo-alpha-sialidase [Fimbriimonadaceae bacterium]
MNDRKALVYKGMPPAVCCCDSALRLLPSGEWITFFMTGGDIEPQRENYVALCRSADQGEVWGPAEVVLQPPDCAATMTEVWIDDGVITLFVNLHAGYFDQWRNYTIGSTDDGHTWSAPQVFEPLPRRGFVRNRCLTSWGEWVVPYQYYEPTGDPDASPLRDGSFESMWAGVLISGDGGQTWQQSPRIRGRCWAEPNVVELSDGRLVMLLRADGTGCLWRSESGDRGRTWSEAQRTDLPNPGSKFRLFRLRDGRIVLLHNPNPLTHHPNSKHYAACNRNPLALWISADDMQTWGYQRVLIDFPGHLAYPDGEIDAAEEWLHFAFDYNRHNVVYWGARLP